MYALQAIHTNAKLCICSYGYHISFPGIYGNKDGTTSNLEPLYKTRGEIEIMIECIPCVVHAEVRPESEHGFLDSVSSA